MKEIAFDSLLLIAADDVSQQAINQLRSDGIYSVENRSCTLINMVVVSTAEGAEHIHQVLENHERARKNVVVKMTPELSALRMNLISTLSCLFSKIQAVIHTWS